MYKRQDEIICSGNEIISDTYKEGNHFVPVYSYSSALGQDVEFRLQLKELQRGYGAALIYFLIGMVVLIIPVSYTHLDDEDGAGAGRFGGLYASFVAFNGKAV